MARFVSRVGGAHLVTARAPGRMRVLPLPLKTLYSLKELARASGLSRGRLERLFVRIGIRTVRVGAYVLIPLAELEEKASPFWESLQLAEHLRQGADP